MRISVTLFLFFFLLTALCPEPVKKDETVIFFPVYGYSLGERSVKIRVHAWVFELEEDSSLRKIVIDQLKRAGSTGKNNFSPSIFRDRIKYFFVDNQRNKDLKIKIEGRNYNLKKTEANGHSVTTIFIDKQPVKQGKKTVQFTAILGAEDPRLFKGKFHVIPPTGLSVISDIDDTVKKSNVLDRRELVRNTFFKKQSAVGGMSRVYRKLEKRGAVFHYVSGSPWQLYPSLDHFLRDFSFPAGTLHLKSLRLKDSSLLSFINGDQMEYKLNIIDRIVTDFPCREFVLIGDSGENDPEVYAEIAGRYGRQVRAIYIRDLGNVGTNSERYRYLRKKAGAVPLILFKNPEEIRKFSAGLEY